MTKSIAVIGALKTFGHLFRKSSFKLYFLLIDINVKVFFTIRNYSKEIRWFRAASFLLFFQRKKQSVFFQFQGNMGISGFNEFECVFEFVIILGTMGQLESVQILNSRMMIYVNNVLLNRFKY